MKNPFIPVNDLKKAIAFANSLDIKHLEKTQFIKSKPNYIETIQVIEKLQNQGWKLNGVCEQRSKSNGKTEQHFIKMSNPDFSMKGEGNSNLILTNSTSGKSPLGFLLGMDRLVCSNQIVRLTKEGKFHQIKHNKQGLQTLNNTLNNINKFTKQNLQKFEELKLKLLTTEEMQILAKKALKLRFDNIDHNQLLKINRDEDKGNDLWLVYNRIQENLTQPNMLIDKHGKLIQGVESVEQDTIINVKLFNLVEEFA